MCKNDDKGKRRIVAGATNKRRKGTTLGVVGLKKSSAFLDIINLVREYRKKHDKGRVHRKTRRPSKLDD
jgi:hypothetical protein